MAKKGQSEYVTREEAAEILNVSVRTIDRYAEKKILTAYVKAIGKRRIYFRRQEVEHLRDEPPMLVE